MLHRPGLDKDQDVSNFINILDKICYLNFVID